MPPPATIVATEVPASPASGVSWLKNITGLKLFACFFFNLGARCEGYPSGAK